MEGCFLGVEHRCEGGEFSKTPSGQNMGMKCIETRCIEEVRAAHLDTAADLEEALGCTVTSAEGLVSLVNVRGQQGGAVSVCAGDQHSGDTL